MWAWPVCTALPRTSGICAPPASSLLPGVLAGLVPCPVLAVPTSVGYGVGAGGMAALHSMLCSCVPGLAVLNIDNGFGAAAFAAKLLRHA